MPVDVILIATVLVVALFVAFVLPSWLKHRSRCLLQSEADIGQAYAASQRLLKDENVPEVVVPLIVHFQAQAGRPGFARRIAKGVIAPKVDTSGEVATWTAAILAGLEELPAERRQDFAILVASSAHSSASSDPLFAGYLRRLVKFSFGLTTAPAHVDNESAVRAVAAEAAPRVSARDCGQLVAA